MKIKITFDKLYVTDNGDPSHETNGELYYSFKIDGTSLVSRLKDNPRDVKDGTTIQLNKSKELDLPHNKVKIKISGYAGDADKGFNGKDEYDDFSTELAFSNNWKEGNNSVHLIDGRLNVTLHYKVEVEGISGNEVLIAPTETASLTIASFDDSPLIKFFQNAHINYGLAFKGYDKSVLIKKVYTSSPKPNVHIKDTSAKKILDTIKELADDGFSIDIWWFSHGTYEKITLDDGEVITSADIENLATGKYAGGRLPLRMVYQMNCNGSTLNNNFIKAGAKAVCGTKYTNLVTTQSNTFGGAWNDGERFDVALRDADTASSRTMAHTLLLADSKGTKFEPKCKVWQTVLGKNKCAEAYFTEKWLSKSEYDSNKSGKDNANAASKQIIAGDAGLRKADRPSW